MTKDMAKRYTDTEKWKKSFIKSLPAEYKLFFLFLLDECDHAGIWHTELEVAEARLGIKLSLEKIRGLFNERVVEFDGGTKMFIPDFINFQYGELNPANKVHKSVIEKLKKYGLMGLVSPLQGAMDKDKAKEKEMDKDEGGAGETIQFPIEDCLRVAMADPRWVKANQATQHEVSAFNSYLEKQGIYQKNPADYKQYFAKLKGRYPNVLKQDLSTEELRRIAQEMDKNS